MEEAVNLEKSDNSSTSLALSFVFTGLGFAFPFLLFPRNHEFRETFSTEVLNLYFLVAWMGQAHFFYAFFGQTKTLRKRASLTFFYLSLLSLGGIILWALSKNLGYWVFNSLVWIYFVPHFIKAEIHFSKYFRQQTPWIIYWLPTLAFAFFSFAVLGPLEWVQISWVLLGIPLALIGLSSLTGLKTQLKDKMNSVYPLMAFFLMGEGLIWGKYRPFMSAQFQVGIYVVHIALASFYHYLKSYYFDGQMKAQKNLTTLAKYTFKTVLINWIVIGIAILAIHHVKPFSFLTILFEIQYFPFWVGFHLVASDLFTLVKNKNP